MIDTSHVLKISNLPPMFAVTHPKVGRELTAFNKSLNFSPGLQGAGHERQRATRQL
jgi:hypothetical protein